MSINGYLGSPFKMNVSAPPLPEKVRVTGPGLEDGPAGDRGHLIIDTKQAGELGPNWTGSS